MSKYRGPRSRSTRGKERFRVEGVGGNSEREQTAAEIARLMDLLDEKAA